MRLHPCRGEVACKELSDGEEQHSPWSRPSSATKGFLFGHGLRVYLLLMIVERSRHAGPGAVVAVGADPAGGRYSAWGSQVISGPELV